jgi:diguanylate cyclase (GGDEF)-like protein
MTTSDTEALLRRLETCADEPIRIPGAVQPHGVLMSLDPETLRVEQVSANSGAVLGVAPEEIIGASPAALIGHAEFASLMSALNADGSSTAFVSSAGPRSEAWECIASRYGDTTIVEVQPLAGAHALGELEVSLSIAAPLARMERARSVLDLLRSVAKDIRAISGFDRVLIYRFDRDFHGEVLAEDVADGLSTAYLGLHFPADDIPPQARELYLLNRLRLIPDVAYEPVPIVPELSPRSQAPLDLSKADLRSVSPMHLQYLQNMGVRAALTISIVVHGKLWGLVACHHRTPRRITHVVRSTCHFFAHMLALALTVRIDQANLAIRLNANQRIAAFVASLEMTQTLWEGLRRNHAALQRIFDADASFVRGPDASETFGAEFAPREVAHAVSLLHETQRSGVADSVALWKLAGETHARAGAPCGGLYIGLSDDDDRCVVLFRNERETRIVWGGEPTKPAGGTGLLTPRASFAAWEEIKRGESAPWSESDLQKAAILREELIAWQTARDHVRMLAQYDPLTHLPNRRLLDEILQRALLEAEARGAMVALLFVDVDRFKRFNDRLGHAAGDTVLCTIAQRLAADVGDGDVVGRFGGDEFIVIMTNVPSRAVAERAAERLARSVAEPLDFRGDDLEPHVSIGISCYPDDGLTSDVLLERADAAMYLVKGRLANAGRVGSNVASGTESNDIVEAIARGEVLAHYQPVFDIASGTVVAVEALVRWYHGTRGLVKPATFIEAAERSDAIGAVGAHMLQLACRHVAGWRFDGEPDLRVAVNVSPLQLRDFRFVEIVRDALRAFDLPGDALELEVTEGVMLENSTSIDALRELADFGVRIVIDDFGTGYSSLNYLRRLPVSGLKIDRSFVAELDAVETRETGRAIIRAIVALGHNLGLSVAAEGVETKSELEVLRADGCDLAQGFYLGFPVVAESYASFTRLLP